MTSAQVERGHDSIVWRDFGFENNYDESLDLSGYKRVEPCRFELARDEAVLREVCGGPEH